MFTKKKTHMKKVFFMLWNVIIKRKYMLKKKNKNINKTTFWQTTSYEMSKSIQIYRCITKLLYS